jgi:glycosyltransferase involved in cell wall biosynthesis
MVANMRLDVKDHPMFLRAAKRVAEVVHDVAFVIAGEGELTESIRMTAIEMGLAEKVFFIGECTNVSLLLSQSEICVLSSKAEGFSNSILEYMAAARPVVVTDVGGAREVVANGKNGFLVPSRDDAAMADRIIELMADPGAARMMGECGRRIVTEKFSCQSRLEATENLYERLIGERASAIESREILDPRPRHAK